MNKSFVNIFWRIFVILILSITWSCSSENVLSGINIFPNVSKMELQNGNDGNFVTITDERTLETITNFFKGEYSKREHEGNQSGWSYRIKGYDRNDKLINDIFIISGSRIKYGNYFYENISNNIIDLDFLESLFMKK